VPKANWKRWVDRLFWFAFGAALSNYATILFFMVMK